MQGRDQRRAANIVFAAVVILVAAVVWWEARQLPDSPFDPLGPASFPILLSFGLAGLALLLLVRALLGVPLENRRAALDSIAASSGPDTEPRPGLAVAVALLTALYVVLLEAGAGFLPATFVYMAATGAAMAGRRRLPVVVALAAVGTLVLSLVFRNLLSVDLP